MLGKFFLTIWLRSQKNIHLILLKLFLKSPTINIGIATIEIKYKSILKFILALR